MNYSKIIPYDTANGEGVRTSLFVSGCTNHCKGCFNQDAQDFNYGKLYTTETEQLILDQVSKPYIAGLSVLGGDPLCQTAEGKLDLLSLITKIKKINKTIWLWTGFTWDEAVAKSVMNCRIIALCDVVVDGPFIEDKKDISLAFRGSSNQRIIDVKQTLQQDKIILWKEGNY